MSQSPSLPTPRSLYRIHLRPATKGNVSANDFCVNKGIVGFGWPIKFQPNTVYTDIEEYLNAAEEQYVVNWRGHKEPRENKGFRNAMSALTGHNNMRIDDLVWSRTKSGVYWLGRITGEWTYCYDKEHRAADVVNFRSCRWVEIGAENHVLGKIIAAFRPPATLQKIHSYYALDFSVREWNKRMKASHEQLSESGKSTSSSFFESISSKDCEDVVSLYLQLKENYAIIPSTWRNDTQAFEFIMIKRDNPKIRAVVQVKQGRVNLDARDFEKLVDEGFLVYLFTSEGKQLNAGNVPGVTFLDPKVVEAFVREQPDILPKKVRHWL